MSCEQGQFFNFQEGKIGLLIKSGFNLVWGGFEVGFGISVKNHADPQPQIMIWSKFEKSRIFIKKSILLITAHWAAPNHSKPTFPTSGDSPAPLGSPSQKYIFYIIFGKKIEKSNFLFSAREPIGSQFRGHQRTQN